jgi:hypothetical protein
MPNLLVQYATNNHDYQVSFGKGEATIICKSDNQFDSFKNPILFNEFEEIIESAAIKGIKNIYFNTTYSIEIQRYHWKNIGLKYNVKITRISN